MIAKLSNSSRGGCREFSTHTDTHNCILVHSPANPAITFFVFYLRMTRSVCFIAVAMAVCSAVGAVTGVYESMCVPTRHSVSKGSSFTMKM